MLLPNSVGSLRFLRSTLGTPARACPAGVAVTLLTWAAGVWGVTGAGVGAALAQPAGSTSLGDFAASSSAAVTPTASVDAANPVRWYSIRLPRITHPHRFLDISTSGPGTTIDTEIALYNAAGVRLAEDDDDGASFYSALSFGILDAGVPGRSSPPVAAGQSPGEPPNGRDGTLSGDPASAGGTAADYYLAVTHYNAEFAANFAVSRLSGPSPTASALVTVRMGTLNGQTAPTVSGQNFDIERGNATFGLNATTSLDTTSVTVDVTSLGGQASVSMNNFGNGQWFVVTTRDTGAPTGLYPVVFRAVNAIGDVTTSQAQATIRSDAHRCISAFNRTIPTTPGTTVYTYDTILGNVDGPWTSACSPFSPTGNDVWFRFVATATGVVSLSTCNSDTGAVGPQPDTLLGFRGRCDDAGFAACADDEGGPCGVGTRLTNLPVTAGNEYNIAVRSYAGDITGGRLAVSFFTFVPVCPADIGSQGGQPGGDGLLNNNDFVVFINEFFNASPVADLGRQGGVPGPDNAWDNNDFIVFINLFFNGCGGG